MSLTLSMICKDELANLKRLKPLVKDYIDEWVVVLPPNDPAEQWCKKNKIKTIVEDYTQEIEPEIVEKMAKLGVDVPEDYRLFNFAAARNRSFSEATGDWILWLDADDEPVGMKNLPKVIKNAQYEAFDAVYDYSRDTEGNSISDHVRERVLKNDERFQWVGGELGLIHETVAPTAGFRPKAIQIAKEDFYVKHISDHADESSMRNHIALLYEYIKTKGKDPRTTYYLGTEFFNRKMWEECIYIMQEYIKVGGWDEERYRAWIRIAEAYHQKGDVESSRNAYLNAVKELPNYPDAYLGLGESYFSTEENDKAIEFFKIGLSKPIPDTKSAVDTTRYKFRPYTFIALCYLKAGRADDATHWYREAVKVNPNHPWLKEYKNLFQESQDINDYVKGFVKMAQMAKKLYPETLPKLAEAIPHNIMDQEILLDFKRRFTRPKVWPKKSIAYFCSEAFEEWGPDSLKTGCGGSEEAVIQLTKRWAKMGYDVTVFNNCPQETEVDGVKWRRFENFNPRDMFDILISWRNNAFLEPKSARKKLVDMHDVPEEKFYPKDALQDVKIMVKSDYHRSLLPNLDDEYFTVIPNGIDMAQFSKKVKKVENNLVWTSSYDRGLEYLLEMWPAILEAVPDATIDVAYGFNMFDKTYRARTEAGMAWKQKMLNLLNQQGVTHHGRLGSDEVAKLYQKADIWAYPTDFPEIDCITATKAQTAKCVPITTDFAVMKERNQGIIIEGDVSQGTTRLKFATELIALMKDKKTKEKIRKQLDTDKFSWDDIAKQWVEEFNA